MRLSFHTLMTPRDVWPLLAFPECELVLPVYQSKAEQGMMFSVVTWLMLTISGLQNWSWKSQEVKRKWHHRRHCESFSSRSFENRTFSDLQYSQDPKTVPKMLYKHGRYSTTHWPVDSLLSANSWLLYYSQRLFGTIRYKTGALSSWTIC